MTVLLAPIVIMANKLRQTVMISQPVVCVWVFVFFFHIFCVYGFVIPLFQTKWNFCCFFKKKNFVMVCRNAIITNGLIQTKWICKYFIASPFVEKSFLFCCISSWLMSFMSKCYSFDNNISCSDILSNTFEWLIEMANYLNGVRIEGFFLWVE